MKDILDRIKGNRSYAQIIIDVLKEKIDVQRKVELLPVSEAVILYYRGGLPREKMNMPPSINAGNATG